MRPAEAAIATIVRKSTMTPAALQPQDVQALGRALGKDESFEVLAVLGCFHYITRLADLVGIESWTPSIMMRRRGLRIAILRLQASLLRWGMDFSPHQVEIDADAELEEIARLRGRSLPDGYRALSSAPTLAASIRALTSRLTAIDSGMLQRVTRAVADALPATEAENRVESPPPTDPLTALAFLGTRYAYRVTPAHVDRVRRTFGWTDAELTDLFYAIAISNVLERFDRLFA